MAKRTYPGRKLIVFLLCAVMLFASMVPGVVFDDNKVNANATTNITIYFDTSCEGSKAGCTNTGSHDNHGWSKSMENVYYYLFKGQNEYGPHPMTATKKKSDDGGYYFSATVDKSEYSTIIFLSTSSWTSDGIDCLWQTQDYSLSGVQNNAVFKLNTSGYDDGDIKKQGVYTNVTYNQGDDYSDDGRFSILNMTADNTSFKIIFTDETRNTKTKVWNQDGTICCGLNGTVIKSGSELVTDVSTALSSITSTTVNARTYDYKKYSVPAVDSTYKKTYQTVEIWTGDGNNLIKKYYLPEGKILGRTVMYGVTEFNTEQSSIGYGDKKKITYQTSDLKSIPQLNRKLYLDNATFYKEKSSSEKTVAEAVTVKTTGTEFINKDGGNSFFKTTANIGADAINNTNFIANTSIDLSGSIYTMVYNGNKYNMFGASNDGDNLISINDNVATISGKYSLQSINNVLTEGGKEYIYASTLAEMYDYQYDYKSASDSSFDYKIDEYGQGDSNVYYPGKILVTDSLGWSNYGRTINAYFYNTSGERYNGLFPGQTMTYVRKNTNGQKQFIIDIPESAKSAMADDKLCVIFSKCHDGSSEVQTVDIVGVKDTNGYYIENAMSDGKYKYGTWPLSTQPSKRGTAKRPYLAINEALSASPYASAKSNYPLYLGQFWLPVGTGVYGYSSAAYDGTTAGKQRAAYNENSNKAGYVDATRDRSNLDRFSGFGNILNNFDWSANLAYRYSAQPPGNYEPYNAVVRNLVSTKLDSGGNIMARDGNTKLPYFNMTFWDDEIRTTSQGNEYKLKDYIEHYEELTFPFFKEDQSTVRSYIFEDRNFATGKLVTDQTKDYTGEYYVFDSRKNVVRYNSSKGDLDKYYNDTSKLVYDTYGNGTSASNSDVGMFPFNDPADGKKSTSDGSNLHYGFGVKFSLEFYLNENGTVDGTKNGTPITFTFQGDDDVWVFLDDQLVLDMGGAHKNAIGEINFAKDGGYVTIGAAGEAGDSIAVSTAKGKYEKSFNQIDTERGTTSDGLVKTATTGKHKITMFYLERGMLNSNLFVMFNLPMSLTKWDIQEDTDFGSVNAGFEKATKYVADRDVFNYTVENKGTAAASVINSEYSAANNAAVTRGNTDVTGVSESIRNTTLSSGPTAEAASKKFAPGSDATVFAPLVSSSGGGVSYRLLDPFVTLSPGEAITDKPVVYDTRKYNAAGNSNVVSLQYGEIANFSKQFAYGSTMKVTQLDTLSSVNDNNRSTYNDSGGRLVSEYYNSYFQQDNSGDQIDPRKLYAGIYRGDDVSDKTLTHVETMYGKQDSGNWVEDSKNYSTNYIINPQLSDNTLTYGFRDPKEAANEYVHLRQVVVNEVKTAKLTISKSLYNSSDTVTTDFPFKIEFKDIFGSTDNNVPVLDYSKITIKKYNSSGELITGTTALGSGGTFKLKVNEHIDIEGIPIKTKYKITEGTANSGERDTYILDGDHSTNVGDWCEIGENNYAVACNAKKTGSFTINKVLRLDDGTTDATGNNTEFNITVTLVNSTETLTNYDIKAGGQHVVFTEGTNSFSAKIKQGTPLSVSGLPVGTTYSVSEGDMPSLYYTKYSDFTLTSGYTRGTDSESNVEYSFSHKTVGGANDTEDKSGIVNVYNKMIPIVMPSTGGDGTIFILPIGILAITLSGAAFVIYRRRLRKPARHASKGRYWG